MRKSKVVAWSHHLGVNMCWVVDVLGVSHDEFQIEPARWCQTQQVQRRWIKRRRRQLHERDGLWSRHKFRSVGWHALSAVVDDIQFCFVGVHKIIDLTPVDSDDRSKWLHAGWIDVEERMNFLAWWAKKKKWWMSEWVRERENKFNIYP